MGRRRLLERISRGHIRSVPFVDFARLVEGFGSRLSRTRGSHRVFAHPKVPDLLDLQEIRGEAKPFQIRQFLEIVAKYDLESEADE